ncbi:MAG: arginine--tRNA ligase [Oscillospiraceae bacterium]|nr:arginine--tRNA ligase [Oscillospiraceae bacterium]
MSCIVTTAHNQMKTIIKSAAETAIKKGDLPGAEIPEFNIEIPPDSKFGDFSTNAAMASARAFRMAPAKIAGVLIENMNLGGTYFERCETAGAGFINFFLNPGYYSDILLDVCEKAGDYGKSAFGEGKKALVEFVSANPTGPMHIGNARGGALGDCLAEVMSWAGYYVEREFYVNDAGNQIEKFALSLETRYLQLYKDGVEMPEDAYHGQDIADHAKNFADVHGDKYVEAEQSERREALVDYALPLNMAALETDLLKYRIKYDTWFLESSLYKSGAVDKILAILKESVYTYENEGALWFKATEFGCEKDFVLIRSNGIPTYIVPDIAYHYNKLVERGFDVAIDVLGADHHGHSLRLNPTVEAFIAKGRLEIVLMQMVNLVSGSETIKLSKRSGKAITLVTLLDEVSVDAARFFFNYREANTHCDFDLDLAVEKSSENPVYYCQYAQARICSILKKLNEKNIDTEAVNAENLKLLDSTEEKELIKHIASLTGEIETAAKTRNPSKITKYAMELAALFHKFYNQCRVDTEDEALRGARITLCSAVRQTMKNVLGILKIDAPEQM